jgi:predicted transcriptional regulator
VNFSPRSTAFDIFGWDGDFAGTIFVGLVILPRMSTVDSTVVARSVKDKVRVLLDSLPDDCTFEDVQYGLFVLTRIQEGLDAVERGDVIPHEEVEKRMQKWLTK